MTEKKKDFDIVSKKKIFIAIPLVLLAVTLLVGIIFGAEISIEFKGGTILTYSHSGDVDIEQVSAEINALNYGVATVTSGEAFGSDLRLINVSFSTSEGLAQEEQETVTATLLEKFPENNIELESNKNVSASTGLRFFLKCLVAFVFSFILFIIYIAIRFKKLGGWSTGVFALLGLSVDVLAVVATFMFFRLPIDSIFMAVVLTIMGYSINNTLIIYDRIRENKSLHGTKLNSRELLNKSVRQSLSRAVNTTVSTAAALVVLSIVAVIFGVSTILNFAFPMLVGMLFGVFTSLCLSGTFWVMWQEHKNKGKRKA
ncbi:MAG: protein translocase subunit SecF [Oscillospiraceae bacterium]|nr:protein translocase subunit SecF [Oscillospiraceae bacterium]